MFALEGAGSRPQGLGWAFGRLGRGAEGREALGIRTADRLLAMQRTRALDVELQIRTDEGDTVTLSFHRESEAVGLRYQHRGRGPEGGESTDLRLRSLSTSVESSLEIEGSLSNAERADIERLVARISASLEAPGGALVSASDAEGEFESLAGYTLDVSRSQAFDLTAVRLRELRLPTPAPIAPEPESPDSAPVPIARSLKSAEPVPVIDLLRKYAEWTRRSEGAETIAAAADTQPHCPNATLATT